MRECTYLGSDKMGIYKMIRNVFRKDITEQKQELSQAKGPNEILEKLAEDSSEKEEKKDWDTIQKSIRCI